MPSSDAQERIVGFLGLAAECTADLLAALGEPETLPTCSPLGWMALIPDIWWPRPPVMSTRPSE